MREHDTTRVIRPDNNLRVYGRAPFDVAVIHGGPGAPGYMAPVARELSGEWGVLEPLQTATSVDGQVEELRSVLENNADLPVALIGSSWGAMLGFIFAGHYPAFVKKLILVGSGVYEETYAAEITETRLSRLSEAERQKAQVLIAALDDPATGDKDVLLAELADLFTKADTYNPITLDIEVLEVQYELNQKVWQDAEELRRSGELLELGRHIQCPVVAIHGDYDPHPAEGIREPLSRVLQNFRFHLLKNCGHYPWVEREARDEFYSLLRKELTMESAEIFRTLIEYHYALYDRVWESIIHLTDEQFVQDVDYSHGSIRDQMVHVAATDARWLRGLKELPDARQFTLDPSEYPTRESARDVWDSTAGEVLDYVAALDEVSLARQPQGIPGPAWQVLAHLVNHGTDHRAQILRALHDFGAPTFDQDLITHLWMR